MFARRAWVLRRQKQVASGWQTESSGWRESSEEIWLSASRGLRGSFRALSGARKRDLVALEPWPTD